jgi:DNA-binding transcriptional LysR family regulator
MRQTGGVVDGDRNVLALPQAPDAIELRHLRAFVAVAEDLSFSRAAQRLFITQPALSRQIRSLERFVGCDLFRRSTQRVDLTLAGESLLARARALLADLDDAISSTRSVGGELAGRMALLWEPWALASAGDADLDGIRAAVEELHGKFTPPPGVTVAPVIAGGVPALRVTPENPPDACVLYLHGGGYISGSAFGYRHLAGAIAATAQASALVVDYRLAPEHPHPAAVHDAMNAYLWLLAAGTDASKIIIAGDSSGGGLAMSLLLALRERDIPLPAGAVPLGRPGRTDPATAPGIACSLPARAGPALRRGLSWRSARRRPHARSAARRPEPPAAHPRGLGRRGPARKPAARQARQRMRHRRQDQYLPRTNACLPHLLDVPARSNGRTPRDRPVHSRHNRYPRRHRLRPGLTEP